MFRRTKSESASTATDGDGAQVAKAGGKGRPTPTRREAEAAAKARAKAPTGRRAAAKHQRAERAEQSRKIRQGMKDGDPRYLPKRDQGPVRAFIRDFVDARLSMAEFALPLLLASLLMSSALPQAATAVMNATLIVVVVDSIIMRWRLKRELRRRFPDEAKSRVTFYAFTRSLQVRFLRLPKPRVKIGTPLPERY